MAEANKELKAGMEVRTLAVPADASKGLGMFDVLNGFEDAAALSDALKGPSIQVLRHTTHSLSISVVRARKNARLGDSPAPHP